mmetsp:Transcript_7632/g.22574  ORF Transcript_7632/g.22574 Transcript_7632/m.22574 type:complete len:218 (+) Transcript_7632:6160-6813(+)
MDMGSNTSAGGGGCTPAPLSCHGSASTELSRLPSAPLANAPLPNPSLPNAPLPKPPLPRPPPPKAPLPTEEAAVCALKGVLRGAPNPGGGAAVRVGPGFAAGAAAPLDLLSKPGGAPWGLEGEAVAEAAALRRRICGETGAPVPAPPAAVVVAAAAIAAAAVVSSDPDCDCAAAEIAASAAAAAAVETTGWLRENAEVADVAVAAADGVEAAGALEA